MPLLSRIANALKSATSVVDISNAAAPTSGQVLTATGPTAATWQTPGGGASGIGWALVSYTSATNQTSFAVSSLDLSTDLAYHVVIRVQARSAAITSCTMTINGSAGAHYNWGGQRILRTGGGSSLNTQGNDLDTKLGLSGNNSQNAFLVTLDMTMLSLDGTTSRPLFLWHSASAGNAGTVTGGEFQYFSGSGYQDAQTNVTSFNVITSSATDVGVWVYKRTTT